MKLKWLFKRLMSKSILFSVLYVLQVPFAIFAIFSSKKIHPSYELSFINKMQLGFRMFFNTLRIENGSTYKAHLAMALKLFELPPASELPGDVLECGTWKGGSAANLSIVCKIVGRKLIICDSFEGLPEPLSDTPDAVEYNKGDYCGMLDEVKANISRCGEIEVCEYVQGWFENTLPELDREIVLAWVDVDLESSLETCVLNIWPHLTENGMIFLDECVGLGYVALFFSESWWRNNFDRNPPGLIGAGTGLGLGNFYVGPYDELKEHPNQHAGTAGYTQKSFEGYWAGPENRR
jgi:hypothetical protein